MYLIHPRCSGPGEARGCQRWQGQATLATTPYVGLGIAYLGNKFWVSALFLDASEIESEHR